MFARVKKSGKYQYLQLVENRKEQGRVKQRVIATLGAHGRAQRQGTGGEQLWQVERVFRDVKSLLITRPIFHQRDRTIRGHVFCSFLALVLRKELDRCLEQAGQRLEWAEIKQDLKALQTVIIEESGKRFAIRSQCQGVCGKVFQAVGVALPPTIREL